MNTERPMDTGQSTVFTVTSYIFLFTHKTLLELSLETCISRLFPLPKAPAGPSGLVQGGSASPRTVLFTVGSPPNSITPPTCSHLGTRPRTTSGGEPTSALVFSGFGKRVCLFYLSHDPLPLCVSFSQWAPTVQLAPCAPPVVGSMSDLLLVWPWARPPQEGLLVAMLFLGAREHPAACAMSPMGPPLPAWRDSSLLKPLSSPRRHSWR